MFAKILIIFIIIVTNIRFCIASKYANFTLFNVYPKESYQLTFLQNLEVKKYIDVQFWTKPKKLFENIQILVNPSNLDIFLERAEHFNLEHSTLLHDVDDAFNNQEIVKLNREHIATDYRWDSYHTLDDIYQWLRHLADTFSNITELEVVGKSFEGKNIYSFEIRRVNATKKIFVEAGAHGNEWIGIEFATYLIDSIINAEKKKDKRLFNVVKKFRWFIIPVLNPDGFQYSQKVDRLWRKNRNVYGTGIGVDLNRNFNYSFCLFGGSDLPKDDYYCGPSAFSEPETKALAEFIMSKKDKITGYFAFHAYGQKLLVPFGDRIRHVGNFLEMENYGKQAILKMYKVSGRTTKYSIGTPFDTLGMRTSGDSAGWVKRTLKPPYVFTFLLRDNGTYGYALPPEEILPTCEETLAGLIEILTARPRSLRADLFSKASMIKSHLIFIILFFYIFY